MISQTASRRRFPPPARRYRKWLRRFTAEPFPRDFLPWSSPSMAENTVLKRSLFHGDRDGDVQSIRRSSLILCKSNGAYRYCSSQIAAAAPGTRRTLRRRENSTIIMTGEWTNEIIPFAVNYYNTIIALCICFTTTFRSNFVFIRVPVCPE